MTSSKHSDNSLSRLNSFYTLGEEIANVLTSILGVMLSIAGLVIMLLFTIREGDVWRIVCAAVYGSSLVLLYSASTLYHSAYKRPIKPFFRKVDHSAIYLLIAGTYTPFLVVVVAGMTGLIVLGFIWSLAVIGIVFKALFIERYEKISTAAYPLMGLLALFMFRDLATGMDFSGLLWLVIGGGVYLVGLAFFLWERLPYNHAIWHLFVIGGSACHFYAVYQYVLPLTS